MEYLALFTIFFSGLLTMWVLSLRERLRLEQVSNQELRDDKNQLAEKLDRTEAQLRDQENRYASLLREHEIARVTFEEVQKYVLETKEQLVDRMKVFSQEVLSSTQEQFFTAAKAHFDESQKRFSSDCSNREERLNNLLNPLKTSLEAMHKKVGDLEVLKKQSQASLTEQIASLSKETSLLIRALRHPSSRGKWGETQLKRLVEMAGLLERCDFFVQEAAPDSFFRADMIVTLPNSRKVIIDAKVPLEGYMKALEAENPDTHEREIENHVEQLEKHIRALSDKKYWRKYHGAIEFTVLFLPSEALLAAAVEKRRDLIERALERKILIATPATLMALLHAIRLGWEEAELHKDLREVVHLAREWVLRSGTFVEHLQKLGKSLSGAVSSYNTAINSFESRFLVTMRKLAKEQRLGPKTALETVNTISVSLSEQDPLEEESAHVPS